MSYSIESKLGDLLDNDATRAILEMNLPGLSDHPQLNMGRGFALTAVLKFSGQALPEGLLDKLDGELKALG